MILSANDLSNQAGDMDTILQQKQQPLYDLLNSIQTFLQDGTLVGKSYAGAKDYFEGYYLPIIRGMIMVNESFHESTAKCLSQLVQLSDSGLVMDTDALEEDIRNLQREWMILLGLDLGLDTFYQNLRDGIQENIREIEKKIQEVYDFDSIMQGLYNETEDCMDAVDQGLSQISRGCYDEKKNRFVPPKGNMQWAKALNKEWAARSIDFKSLNSEYWNRTDGYFCENWWQDPEKLKEAAKMLKEEARLLGGIDLQMLNGQYRVDEMNHRIYAVQALANVLRTGSYDVETVYHLELNYLTGDMDYTRAHDVLSVKGIELLQKRQKDILLKEAGDWVERSGLVETVRGLAQLTIMTSNYFTLNNIKVGGKAPKIKGTKVKGAGGANFGDETKLESHFSKHGKEFKGTYGNADEYLQGARDVMKNGTKVQYNYKGEVRNGYVKFMGNNSKGNAKFEFVGTNAKGEITTYHVESGKTFWKMLNGKNIPEINPVD